MNKLTYKNGKLKLKVGNFIVPNHYIVSPMLMQFDSGEKPTVKLEILLDVVEAEDLEIIRAETTKEQLANVEPKIDPDLHSTTE